MPSPSTIASFNGASASSLPPCFSDCTQTTELVMAAERVRDQALAGCQHAEERLRGLGGEPRAGSKADHGHYEGRELDKNVMDTARREPTEDAVPATT